MELAQAHIELERRLRVAVGTAAGRAWSGLPAYDRANVDQLLTAVLPAVNAAQRRSVALTDAYLARALERQPLGIDAVPIIGAARAGATSEEVYTRPFVTVWTALDQGKLWDAAVAEGLARITSAAATDVQLAMRGAAREIGMADDGIFGFARVPDPGACELCLLAAGQRYSTDDLMPIHNHCGCGVEPETDNDFTPSEPSISNDDGLNVTIADHGELGPMLVNADQHFSHI